MKRYPAYSPNTGWIQPNDPRKFILISESGMEHGVTFLGVNSPGNLYHYREADGTERAIGYTSVRGWLTLYEPPNA